MPSSATIADGALARRPRPRYVGHVSSQLTSESPRQGLNARQQGTVEKLLAAGLDELREVGHEALTIRTVAQRAGVSPATAYTYLASKHHLFAELFSRHIAVGRRRGGRRARPRPSGCSTWPAASWRGS